MRRHPTISRACEQCGKSFHVYPYEIKRGRGRFCCRQCSTTHSRRPLKDRFWAKVNKDGPVPAHRPELGPCWLWTAMKNPRGYGCVQKDNARKTFLLAHRVSWELYFTSIPAGLCILHRCDNRRCVRPDHLFLGTKADNMADRYAKGRYEKGEKTGRAKLTEAAVREIRRLFAAGCHNKAALSMQFGVSRPAIRLIVLGKCWKHI
jgi:hypothetical protein